MLSLLYQQCRLLCIEKCYRWNCNCEISRSFPVDLIDGYSQCWCSAVVFSRILLSQLLNLRLPYLEILRTICHFPAKGLFAGGYTRLLLYTRANILRSCASLTPTFRILFFRYFLLKRFCWLNRPFENSIDWEIPPHRYKNVHRSAQIPAAMLVGRNNGIGFNQKFIIIVFLNFSLFTDKLFSRAPL